MSNPVRRPNSENRPAIIVQTEEEFRSSPYPLEARSDRERANALRYALALAGVLGVAGLAALLYHAGKEEGRNLNVTPTLPQIENTSVAPAMTATPSPTSFEAAGVQVTATPSAAEMATATAAPVNGSYDLEHPFLNDRQVSSAQMADIVQLYFYEKSDFPTGFNIEKNPLSRQYMPYSAEQAFLTRAGRQAAEATGSFNQGDQLFMNLEPIFASLSREQVIAGNMTINQNIDETPDGEYYLNQSLTSLVPELADTVISSYYTNGENLTSLSVVADGEQMRLAWVQQAAGLAEQANRKLGLNFSASQIAETAVLYANLLAKEKYTTQPNVYPQTEEIRSLQADGSLRGEGQIPAFDAFTRQLDMNPDYNPADMGNREDQDLFQHCVALEVLNPGDVSLFETNIDVRSIFASNMMLNLADLNRAFGEGHVTNAAQLAEQMFAHSTAVIIRYADKDGVQVNNGDYESYDALGNVITIEELSQSVVLEEDCVPEHGVVVPIATPTGTVFVWVPTSTVPFNPSATPQGPTQTPGPTHTDEPTKEPTVNTPVPSATPLTPTASATATLPVPTATQPAPTAEKPTLEAPTATQPPIDQPAPTPSPYPTSNPETPVPTPFELRDFTQPEITV